MTFSEPAETVYTTYFISHAEKVTQLFFFCILISSCFVPAELGYKQDQMEDVGKGDTAESVMSAQGEGSETQYDMLISFPPGNLTPPEHNR